MLSLIVSVGAIQAMDEAEQINTGKLLADDLSVSQLITTHRVMDQKIKDALKAKNRQVKIDLANAEAKRQQLEKEEAALNHQKEQLDQLGLSQIAEENTETPSTATRGLGYYLTFGMWK